jgi:hypothetical protein
MPSTASHVGRLMHQHEVENDIQENHFAREEQQARAAEDRKRQDLNDRAENQARTAAPSGGRAPVRSISDQEHADNRIAVIQNLQHKHDGLRKARTERQTKEIAAARKKPPTPGTHQVPREPEPHHGVSVIWKDLDSARWEAVQEVRRQYATLHDKADAEHLDVPKSQAAGRYAKAGSRTADDLERQHEEAHRKIAADEYQKLRTLLAQLEAELEMDRRRIHQQATERGMLAKKQFEENERARR